MTKFCPSCGESLVDNAKFCKSCGHSLAGEAPRRPPERPVAERSYIIAIVLGYVFVLVFTLIGLAVGIYLVTRRDSDSAKRHGKYIILISASILFLKLAGIIYRGVI